MFFSCLNFFQPAGGKTHDMGKSKAAPAIPTPQKIAGLMNGLLTTMTP